MEDGLPASILLLVSGRIFRHRGDGDVGLTRAVLADVSLVLMPELSSASGDFPPNRSSTEPESAAPVPAEQAMRELVERNLEQIHDVVVRVVRRFRRHLEMEDILQELFIRLLDAPRRGVRFQNDAHVLRYARQVARHLLIDQFRRNSVRKHQPLEVDDSDSDSSVASHEAGPLDQLLALETDHRVQETFTRILALFPDARMQKLVVQHYKGGRSPEELADEMQVSRATAYTWLSRFRSALRRALQELPDQ